MFLCQNEITDVADRMCEVVKCVSCRDTSVWNACIHAFILRILEYLLRQILEMRAFLNAWMHAFSFAKTQPKSHGGKCKTYSHRDS